MGNLGAAHQCSLLYERSEHQVQPDISTQDTVGATEGRGVVSLRLAARDWMNIYQPENRNDGTQNTKHFVHSLLSWIVEMMHCFLLAIPLVVAGFIGVFLLAKKINKEE